MLNDFIFVADFMRVLHNFYFKRLWSKHFNASFYKYLIGWSR